MASMYSLVPRASLALHARQLQLRLRPVAVRAASTSPPKPRVLEKPERFNPPSHPSRLRSRPRQYPGPPLSDHERQAQKTRRYPHMMPPDGSFLHWFLTNRMLHVWITMSILVSLVVGTWWVDFMQNSPDRELLPPNSMFFAHPIAFIHRYIDVYWMYVEHTSIQTAERRRQNIEDVTKRAQFKKAHGLDKNEGFGGWMAKTDEELMAATIPQNGNSDFGHPTGEATDLASASGANAESRIDEGAFLGANQETQPVRKKWFGIW